MRLKEIAGEPDLFDVLKNQEKKRKKDKEKKRKKDKEKCKKTNTTLQVLTWSDNIFTA